MQLHRQACHFSSDFRVQSSFLIALTSLVLLTPFAVNNFLENRYLIGAGALAIIVIMAFNAWDTNRGNSRPWVVLYILTPCITIYLSMCFQTQGIIAALWTFPVILFFYCTLEDRKAWAANLFTLGVVIPQGWIVLDSAMALGVSVTLVAVSVFSAISARVTTSYQKTLEDRIITDPLTGLLNRTVLDDTLNAAVEQHKRLGTPMSILLLDLDHFKDINDTHGHQTGDLVLIEVSRIIKQTTRLSDSCFRIGGEEFLCLLYGSDLDNSKRLAEKIRSGIEQLEVIPDQRTTTSIGVASVQSSDTWQTWYKHVDKHLYKAKNSGRNNVS